MAYEIELVPDACMSAGKCVASAPGFFVFDDDELVALDESGPRPDDAALLRIARACPSGAILLTEDGVDIDI